MTAFLAMLTVCNERVHPYELKQYFVLLATNTIRNWNNIVPVN